jgi:hypothetical protein
MHPVLGPASTALHAPTQLPATQLLSVDIAVWHPDDEKLAPQSLAPAHSHLSPSEHASW